VGEEGKERNLVKDIEPKDCSGSKPVEEPIISSFQCPLPPPPPPFRMIGQAEMQQGMQKSYMKKVLT